MPKSKLWRAALAAMTLFAILALAGPALAKSPINKTFWGGLAIEGYDPVAYFTLGKPTQGKEKFSFEWKGAAWRFASAKHLQLFKAAPEKYAPQYGGYCAWAVAQGGGVAGIEPARWRIVNGKLYLNYDKEVQKKWEKDIPGNIKKADQNWPKVLE